MKARLIRIAAATATSILAAGLQVQAFAADTLGQPTDGAIDFQPAATALRQQAMNFHTFILLPVLFGISALVLGLLLWCIIRYNKRANQTPARFTHNTAVEIAWTTVPVLILLVIAIVSLRLLFDYHDMPAPYMTVKVTGYQWYWGYEYPDQKIAEQTSTMATEQQAALDKVQYKLAATNPMVVPVGKVVRVLVTGADVIHSFSVNAFGVKVDAVPGRVNQIWFKATTTGTFTGQCSQLCGIDHAFMPIEVKVLSQADFDAWVKSKAPKPPAATNAAAPTTAATTAVVQPAAAAAVAKP
jgi:cytochrome c oxidase subunit 2